MPLSVDLLIRQSPKYAIQITPGIWGFLNPARLGAFETVESPPVFRDFPPVYLLDCGKGGTLQKKCEKEKIFSMTIDLPHVAARTVDRIRLPPYNERVTKVSLASE